jgi:hypothetical protein
MPKKGSSKKAAVKKTKTTAAKTRVRKPTKKQAKASAKTEAVTRAAVPSSFKLTARVAANFKQHWRVLLGIVAVYLILNILFASGLSNLSGAVSTIRSDFSSNTQPHTFAKAVSGFLGLVGSAGSSGSSSASVLQSCLFIIESLVIIWALRQLLAGRKIGVKEAYYSSMYPLIPFLLVVFVIILQLLPISFGALVVNAVVTSAAASLSLATWISWIIFLSLAAWSFYMLSSSIFALYIVTLPDMQPREALKSAKNLVSYRRLKLIPKIIYLPVFILVVMAIIIIPLIIFASVLVAPVFYILSMLAILFIHNYLYALYRSLLV